MVLKSFELRLWVFFLDVLLTAIFLLQAIPLEPCKLSADLDLTLREKLSAVRGVKIAVTTRNDGVPSITGRPFHITI
ncbi:hypothetical protein DKX38_024786 [Salix brachista]|uniref:Uncharacterized protein n=1 Tax=Salix brachista TaxID=2182728 RepID=A0A5N5K021_9ROSI|nr:hypothetical protein DKX38_024786 [Salix brachista]